MKKLMLASACMGLMAACGNGGGAFADTPVFPPWYDVWVCTTSNHTCQSMGRAWTYERVDACRKARDHMNDTTNRPSELEYSCVEHLDTRSVVGSGDTP